MGIASLKKQTKAVQFMHTVVCVRGESGNTIDYLYFSDANCSAGVFLMNGAVYTGRSENVAQHLQFSFTTIAPKLYLREPPRERAMPEGSVKGELVDDTLEAYSSTVVIPCYAPRIAPRIQWKSTNGCRKRVDNFFFISAIIIAETCSIHVRSGAVADVVCNVRFLRPRESPQTLYLESRCGFGKQPKHARRHATTMRVVSKTYIPSLLTTHSLYHDHSEYPISLFDM